MYSAESIITALKANTELKCEGLENIKCPSVHEGCTGNSDTCALCISQKCKQPLSIHRNLQKLVVITFRFKVSKSNCGGFIRKDDSALKKLIDRNFIDKTKLSSV
ncbi:MAG: hypothetical protein FWB86_09540 [Treponema sp.]|nr:hypothetical protein [Treponema sp.]MCL2252260.1 hypothetical protein [Treponema sp.]